MICVREMWDRLYRDLTEEQERHRALAEQHPKLLETMAGLVSALSPIMMSHDDGGNPCMAPTPKEGRAIKAAYDAAVAAVALCGRQQKTLPSVDAG